MSSRTPQSKVFLYSGIPFDLTYTHTRWFTSKSEQNSFFSGYGKRDVGGVLTYVRPERGEVKVNQNRENLLNVNYLTFDNGNKIYYAFVTDIKYGNNNMAIIEFEIDVLQTYMFDVNFKQSFIEREHCKLWNSDGTPVVNTTVENLDLGYEYEILHRTNFNNGINDTRYILISTTERLDGDPIGINHNLMSSLPTTLFHYIWAIRYRSGFEQLGTTTISSGQTDYSGTQENRFSKLVEYLTNDKNANKVVAINFLPFLPFQHSLYPDGNNIDISSTFLSLLPNKMLSRVRGNNFYENSESFYVDDVFDKAMNGRGITESKLLMYPYTYLSLIDNNGNSVDLYPQYLRSKKLRLSARAVIDTRYRTVYTPIGYRNNSAHLEDSLITNISYDIPIINDYTATYLQGNRNSLLNSTTNNILGGAISAGIGGAMLSSGNVYGAMGVAGGVGNILKTITGTIAKTNDIKNIPDNITKQQSNSIFNIADNKLLPNVLIKQISKEKIDVIQSYFRAYGYAVNKTKLPNLKTRQHFNYVKTIGANITGAIPQDSLNKFKSIFDNGVTLWHTNDMYNYTLTNGVR